MRIYRVLSLAACMAACLAAGAARAQGLCNLPNGGQSGLTIVFDQINAARVSNKLVPLKISVPLTIAAQMYACKLAYPAASGLQAPSNAAAYVEMRTAGCRAQILQDAVVRAPVDGLSTFAAIEGRPVIKRTLESTRMRDVGLGIASTTNGLPVWVILTSSGC